MQFIFVKVLWLNKIQRWHIYYLFAIQSKSCILYFTNNEQDHAQRNGNITDNLSEKVSELVNKLHQLCLVIIKHISYITIVYDTCFWMSTLMGKQGRDDTFFIFFLFAMLKFTQTWNNTTGTTLGSIEDCP